MDLFWAVGGGEQDLCGRAMVNISLKEVICAFVSQALNLT